VSSNLAHGEEYWIQHYVIKFVSVLWQFGGFTQQYFSYIVAVSFIGGGNRRKPPTYHKSLPFFYRIMLYTLPWAGVEPTTSVVIDTD
jgi:hypothetical protein